MPVETLEPAINASDTAWILMSSALVMLMTPGLAFFYGGLVRQKNVLSTLMHSFFMLALISVQWVVVGYSLAFAPSMDPWGLVGNFDFVGLQGVGAEPSEHYAGTIPHMAFMMFQMMFAIITPALISGAFAERQRFGAFVAFSLLWATLVYDPITHWVWSTNGWIANLGALDFAGGLVVHISSGVSALVCALVLGARRTEEKDPAVPHNTTMTLIGTGMLWFGWFGFNAGSALAADGLAVHAFVTTNTAAGAGMLAWTAMSYLRHKRPSVLGSSAGAVVGLVVITPAAGFVTPMAALFMGLLGGVLCFITVEYVVRGRVDDALDVFGVHGVGGIIGALLVGVFATTSVNPGGADGLLYGNAALLGKQALTIVVVGAYSAIMTWGLLKLVNLFIPVRVSAEAEDSGLDKSLHGESAYVFGN
jgi:Amt family ammonium transporter